MDIWDDYTAFPCDMSILCQNTGYLDGIEVFFSFPFLEI
jgi:hypothetical protein